MTRIILAIALLFLSSASAYQKTASNSSASVLAGEIPAASTHATEPGKYHFVTEYAMLGPQGMETGTHVVTADFLATDKEVHWSTVTVGQAAGHAQPPTTAEHQSYIEGFAYARDAQKITSPDFFRSFPATAIDEKNLVWDELMFHSFAVNIDRLKLNEVVLAQSGEVALAGSGKFNNRRIELTLRGVARRNGEDCYLIHYEALLNRFTVSGSNFTVSGRSDYLGDIWVSIRTREIEYGTLLEEVAGVVGNVPGAASSQPMHVLRTATLQRLK